MNLQAMSREQLEALVSKMAAASQRKLSCKVSEKGAIAVYGLGRFPVTLYASQWEQLIPFIKSGAIEDCMAVNADKISRKE